jgi:hypothetical protein
MPRRCLPRALSIAYPLRLPQSPTGRCVIPPRVLMGAMLTKAVNVRIAKLAARGLATTSNSSPYRTEGRRCGWWQAFSAALKILPPAPSTVSQRASLAQPGGHRNKNGAALSAAIFESPVRSVL